MEASRKCVCADDSFPPLSPADRSLPINEIAPSGLVLQRSNDLLAGSVVALALIPEAIAFSIINTCIASAILTVTEGFKEPRRAMIAFDGGVVTKRGVEMVSGSPLFRGLPIHLVMSGPQRQDAPKQLGWAQQTLEAAGFEAPVLLAPGDAESVITRAIHDLRVDMLVMGAYAHSWLRARLLGSKTSDLLRAATVPTLLLRQGAPPRDDRIPSAGGSPGCRGHLSRSTAGKWPRCRTHETHDRDEVARARPPDTSHTHA